MATLEGTLLLNRYRVDEFLGRGGMAEVYKVWDQQRLAFLAAKVLHADLAEDKVFLRRFRREASTLAALQHPNIVRFYGLETDADRVFMLMDFVEGDSLRKEIFHRATFSPADILSIARPVCSALQYAHNQGVIHCDVKPANIMLDRRIQVFVSDFGIARITESATSTTMFGAGTPAYMSPEQARGQALTPQTDIYALGVTLYELLTGGERPFTGEHSNITGSTAERVRWEHLNLAPPSLLVYNPALPTKVDGVVQRCLEKDPFRRFESMVALEEALEAALCGSMDWAPAPVEAPRPMDSPTVAAMTERHLPLETGAGTHAPTLAFEPVDGRKPAQRKLVPILVAVGAALILLSTGLAIFAGLLAPDPALAGIFGGAPPTATDTSAFTPTIPSTRAAQKASILPTATAPALPATKTASPTAVATRTATSSPTLPPSPTAPAWELAWTLEGHTEAANTVDFSPDGSALVSGGADDALLVWDPSSGARLQTVKARQVGVKKIVFSPGGDSLAAISDLSAIVIWNAKTWKPRATLQGHSATVNDITFSPDGRLLGSSSDDGSTILWDAKSGSLVKTLVYRFILAVGGSPAQLSTEKKPVRCVAFTGQGKTVEGQGIWDLSTFKPEIPEGGFAIAMESPVGSASAVAVSEDGGWLALGSDSGGVVIRDQPNVVVEDVSIDTGMGKIIDLDFTPDGTRLAVAAENGTAVTVWDVQTGTLLYQLEGLAGPFTSVAFSPDGVLLAAGAKDGRVLVWRFSPGN